MSRHTGKRVCLGSHTDGVGSGPVRQLCSPSVAQIQGTERGLWRSTATQLPSPLTEGEVRKAKKLIPKNPPRGHGQEQELAGPCAPWSSNCPSYLLPGGCFWEAEAEVLPAFRLVTLALPSFFVSLVVLPAWQILVVLVGHSVIQLGY